MNPQPYSVNLPGEGQVFRVAGDNTMMWQINNGQLGPANGQLYITPNTDIQLQNGTVLKAGQRYLDDSVGGQGMVDKGTVLDHSFSGNNYRVDYSNPYNASLPEYNKADIAQHIATGGTFGATPTSKMLNTQAAPLATPAAYAAATNAQTQQLAGNQGMNVQTATDANGTIVASGKTALGGPSVNTAYYKQPNESIDQYNQRISAMNPNIPLPQSGGAISSSSMTGGQTPSYVTPSTQAPYDPTHLLNAGNTTPQLTEGPQQQKYSTLSDQLQSLITQDAGKAGYQNEQNSKYGVDTQQQVVDDLNAQLSTVVNESATIKLTPQQGEGVTTAVDQRQRDFALNQNSIKALGISSLLNAAKGLLSAAQGKADRTVGLIFDPIEAQIAAAKQNLQLIANDPKMSLEEKNQAQQQLDIKNAQQQAIAQQRADTADIWDLASKAAANGQNFTPTAQYQTLSLALQAIQNAPSKSQALLIAASTGLTQNKAAAPKIIGSASTGYYQVDAQGNTTPLVEGAAKAGGSATGTGGKQYDQATKFITDNPSASYDELFNTLLQYTNLTSTEANALLASKGVKKPASGDLAAQIDAAFGGSPQASSGINWGAYQDVTPH